MADCVDIKLERVRAYIQVGQHYFVTTGTDDKAAGSIMSFSINKSRGQPIATFRCQLSVWADAPVQPDLEVTHNNLGQKIVVCAGAGEQSDTSLPRLFTGYVTNITQDPHWDDSRKYILNVSGEDEFALMKYGAKYSRRFKYGDDAFAVITGGKRREGGRMTRLRKVPAGSRGVSHIAAGSNTSLEHSPLIKTPDPQGTSPSAPRHTGGSSKKAEDPQQGSITMVPPQAYMNSGDKIFVVCKDKDGNPIDPTTLKNTVGSGCLCIAKPAPSSFTSTATKSTNQAEGGLKDGEKTYPVSVTYTTQGGIPGFLFTLTGDYPCQVTFVHPLTGQTATINFHQIPPHDHRDLSRGGPAVGSFDQFQV